jgi:hypothetical protein
MARSIEYSTDQTRRFRVLKEGAYMGVDGLLPDQGIATACVALCRGRMPFY